MQQIVKKQKILDYKINYRTTGLRLHTTRLNQEVTHQPNYICHQITSPRLDR